MIIQYIEYYVELLGHIVLVIIYEVTEAGKKRSLSKQDSSVDISSEIQSGTQRNRGSIPGKGK
jgi:hypothetical protein